jgi:glycosyltransferase involved in cell wall biosynthesis
MKLLILCPYPHGIAPSQRFRFEQYLDSLKQRGYDIYQQSFWDLKTWEILYENGHYGQKILGTIKGFTKRLIVLFFIKKYDLIFIHREATPLGFPFIEFLLVKFYKKNFIFDFDDAIWLPNTSKQNKWVSKLKFSQKTALICRLATRISVGNDFLATYAIKYNSSVYINPTTIDTDFLHNPERLPPKKNTKPVIGWTGTHSTLQYLNLILPVLREIEKSFDFKFLIISNQDPKLNLKSYYFIKWNKKNEIEDLNQIDIGLMPLTQDEWSLGKCGFKALQYMALEKATIASPVGINKKIIDHNINGMLCETREEWKNALVFLLTNEKARTELGKNARKKVINHYSVKSNTENFLRIIGYPS